jgi:hypothetical protein
MTEASHAVEDLVGCLRPQEGLGVPIRDLDVLPDGRLEFAGAAMHVPAQLLVGKRGERAFDEI